MPRTFSGVKVIGGDNVALTTASPLVYLATGCSAVVISPYKLLTAGHCVLKAPEPYSPLLKKGQKIQISAIAGKPFNNGLQTFEATMTAVEVHNSWRDKLMSYGNPDLAADDPDSLDLALITLDGNLPIKPASLITEKPVPQQNVLLVGAGCDNRSSQSLGAFRQAPLKIDSVAKFKFVIGTKRSDDSNKQAGACAGDSGGGAFLQEGNGKLKLGSNGEWILTGISSVLASAKNWDEYLKPLSLTSIRVDTEAAVSWLLSQKSKEPFVQLKDTEPQTIFEFLEQVRKNIQNNDEFRASRIKAAIEATPELKNKLPTAKIDEIAKKLLAPENANKTAQKIIESYF